MKYIVLVPDGMADEPMMQLNGKTPLEAATSPHMDFLASQGMSGLVKTIPDDLPPGSDIGNLALMGYDPNKCFSGRAPLEAANMGIILADDEIAFRCNLITSFDGIMTDYSAGHIPTDQADQLISALQQTLGSQYIHFYSGKSYRHLLVLKVPEKEFMRKARTTPPHDILNHPLVNFLPLEQHGSLLRDLMEKSKAVLSNHPINQQRIKLGLMPANMIWLWGQGVKPQLPLFKNRTGLSGSVISAVDLVNGIGRLAGLHVIDVPGANGYYDTNYLGKVEYALDSLQHNDFVYIHIEGPDEAGHSGDLKSKISCIEQIDAIVVKRLIEYEKTSSHVRILICPDHPTPVALRTHTRNPVPFILYGSGIKSNEVKKYSESDASKQGILFESGEKLLAAFFKGDRVHE